MSPKEPSHVPGDVDHDEDDLVLDPKLRLLAQLMLAQPERRST
ncbi:MAG: hypothetical protein Q9O62_09075 [Ardenticatenia bacterium]|nr:hypothetical protein [Ardenticatenia bacterium]